MKMSAMSSPPSKRCSGAFAGSLSRPMGDWRATVSQKIAVAVVQDSLEPTCFENPAGGKIFNCDFCLKSGVRQHTDARAQQSPAKAATALCRCYHYRNQESFVGIADP